MAPQLICRPLGLLKPLSSGQELLVYLDSAFFAVLERESVAAQDRFVASWREAGLELALSLHHLQEIAQLSDVTSVTRRLEILSRFHAIRCAPATSATVLELESQLQLLTLLGFTVDARRSALDTLFPPAPVGSIQSFTLAARSTFLQMQSLLSLEAEAHELSKHARRQSPQKSMRRPLNLASLGYQGMAEIKAMLGSSAAVDSELSSGIVEDTVSALHNSETIRGALEELLGLSDLECRNQIADEDLTEVAVFIATAAEQTEAVARRTRIDQESVCAALTRLNPYASPGFALRLAVNRARRNRPEPEHSSNDLDASHAAFAPYVDRLVVDKRTYGFILQERRDRPGRLPPIAGQNIVRTGDLESLLQTIGIPVSEA